MCLCQQAKAYVEKPSHQPKESEAKLKVGNIGSAPDPAPLDITGDIIGKGYVIMPFHKCHQPAGGGK